MQGINESRSMEMLRMLRLLIDDALVRTDKASRIWLGRIFLGFPEDSSVFDHDLDICRAIVRVRNLLSFRIDNNAFPSLVFRDPIP